MWKPGKRVTLTGYNKHKGTVKLCKCENHYIIAKVQRAKFKEAKENLRSDCYVVLDTLDISRA